MATVSTPKRGEVWLVRFDPSAGAEIRKVRPAVVVNLDAIGRLPYESWLRSRIGRATLGISRARGPSAPRSEAGGSLVASLAQCYTSTRKGDAMQTVFIKFVTREDRVRGFYELATKAKIGSFPDEVYQVPVNALKLLDDQQVAYRRATDAEVKAAHDQIRNPAPAVL